MFLYIWISISAHLEKNISLLKQPHPAHDDFRLYFRHITTIAVLIFLLLWLMSPFSFSRLPEEQRIHHAAMYGIGAFVVMLANFGWVLLFPKFCAQQNWSLCKEILMLSYQISSIAIMVWLVGAYFTEVDKDRNYFKAWLTVATGGILPYTIATLAKHTYLLKKGIREGAVLSQIITDKRTEKHAISNLIPEPLVQGLDIDVPQKDFLYAESRGNYLYVYAKTEDVPREIILRMTIKQFTDLNVQSERIFRCHQGYVIHLDNILRVEGNAAGYELTMHPTLPKVSVSRRYIKTFRSLMNG